MIAESFFFFSVYYCWKEEKEFFLGPLNRNWEKKKKKFFAI